MNRRLLPLLWLLLLPFVVIVWWVQPSLDDLSIPLMLRAGESSRLELFRHLMHTWNGRYTSNLLAVLSPYTWESLFGYRLLLMLQFPALYFALYYLLSRLLSPANPQPDIKSSPAPAPRSGLQSHLFRALAFRHQSQPKYWINNLQPRWYVMEQIEVSSEQ